MKKKPNGFVSVLLALCLLLAPMTVFAESNAQLNYVTDDVGILTDSQWEDLEQRAQQVSEEYQCGVYMITVDDYTDYSTESVYTADYTIYHDYEMGMGEDRDGIMILLSMGTMRCLYTVRRLLRCSTRMVRNSWKPISWIISGMTTGMEALVTISMPAAITYSLQSREHLSVRPRDTIPVTMRIMKRLPEKISE